MGAISFIIWVYLVYRSWQTPKREKIEYKVEYSLPFDVRFVFNDNGQDYVLISHNQN